MPGLKIVLVGGGSTNWTPRLVCNILRNEFLDGACVVLYDLNTEALAQTHALAIKHKALAGCTRTIEQATDRSAALDGADAVVVTISTGGLEAMKQDLEVPEAFGIYQTVGDTAGPGGLVRGLRNIPVFLDLARAMETHCPDAWMLNCSNPLSTITRAVSRETRIRALGVCHGVCGAVRHYAKFFGVESCSYVNSGIDHCSWFTALRVDGRPVEARLLEKGLDDWLALPAEKAEADPTFGDLFSYRSGFMLGRQLGALPAIGDRHMVEFFPGFLNGLDAVERHGLVRTTISDREKRAADGTDRIERQLNGQDEIRLLDSGDDIAGWIEALYGGTPKEDNISAPNIGQIPQLPDGAVVETRGVLDATGCHPLVSPMPQALEAAVRPHSLREELTVDAAIEGNFEKALAALSTDPLLYNADVARPLLEALIQGTRRWLPRF